MSTYALFGVEGRRRPIGAPNLILYAARTSPTVRDYLMIHALGGYVRTIDMIRAKSLNLNLNTRRALCFQGRRWKERSYRDGEVRPSI